MVLAKRRRSWQLMERERLCDLRACVEIVAEHEKVYVCARVWKCVVECERLAIDTCPDNRSACGLRGRFVSGGVLAYLCAVIAALNVRFRV